MRKFCGYLIAVVVLLSMVLPAAAQDSVNAVYLPIISNSEPQKTYRFDPVVADPTGCGTDTTTGLSFCPPDGAYYSMLRFTQEGSATRYYLGSNSTLYYFVNGATELVIEEKYPDLLRLHDWPVVNEPPMHSTTQGIWAVRQDVTDDGLTAVARDATVDSVDPVILSRFFTKLVSYLDYLSKKRLQAPELWASPDQYFEMYSQLSVTTPRMKCAVTEPVAFRPLGFGFMAPITGAGFSIHVAFSGNTPSGASLIACMYPHEYIQARFLLTKADYKALRDDMEAKGFGGWEDAPSFRIFPAPGLVLNIGTTVAKEGGVVYTLETTAAALLGFFFILTPEIQCFIESGATVCDKQFDPTAR